MSSGLPTPPMEDHKSHLSRKISKPSKSLSSRTSKRSSPPHEHSVVLDGRHKRVWKACERCRMKKTKCDGESPCKRCKDDGLVCTAGSRKKTEFKQLPRGYAEVLENTQYALIATVQKLYTMVRNNEAWELGDPEMNDRGQPVIHDIASKLGCIRPSPDLPFAFPEGEQDFADLQAQLQNAPNSESQSHSDDTSSRKHSEDSSYSPGLHRTERASSSESDHSNLSKDYNQMIWTKQQASKVAPSIKPTPLNLAQRRELSGTKQFLQESFPNRSFPARASIDTSCSNESPIYTEFGDSPFRNGSPFAPWSGGDDFLGQGHPLDLTAQFMRQQAAQSQQMQIGNMNRGNMDQGYEMEFKPTMNDLDFTTDGTIRPGMLDCAGFGMADLEQCNGLYQSEYEGLGMMLA